MGVEFFDEFGITVKLIVHNRWDGSNASEMAIIRLK